MISAIAHVSSMAPAIAHAPARPGSASRSEIGAKARVHEIQLGRFHKAFGAVVEIGLKHVNNTGGMKVH